MLSPEQAQDLVDYFGSQSEAGRQLGIPRSSLRYWLDPGPDLARSRARYARDPEPKRELMRKWFHGLSGAAYSDRQLQVRRNQARHYGRKRFPKELAPIFSTIHQPKREE